MRNSKKNKKVNNRKTISSKRAVSQKSKNKCVYTDEAKRVLKNIIQLRKRNKTLKKVVKKEMN